ncbi:MAG TPA: hypothetical protein ENJ95_13240 [Bacteroidetes bacterium]|nr:hypothetical protein [Bacteroidota bacterium]
MKNLIKRNINGSKVLSLFILTNIVYAFMLLVTIPKVMNFSGGMKLLDMLPAGYNARYVKLLFGSLGEKGREVYLFNQIPVDMVYPFLFGITYCLVLAYFLDKLKKLNSPLIYLCLLPVLAGVFDYGENIGIIKMLNSYPNISNILIETTNISTILKSVFTTIYFVVLLVTMLAVGINKLRSRQ